MRRPLFWTRTFVFRISLPVERNASGRAVVFRLANGAIETLTLPPAAC
jgi:hypothetical protein